MSEKGEGGMRCGLLALVAAAALLLAPAIPGFSIQADVENAGNAVHIGSPAGSLADYINGNGIGIPPDKIPAGAHAEPDPDDPNRVNIVGDDSNGHTVNGDGDVDMEIDLPPGVSIVICVEGFKILSSYTLEVTYTPPGGTQTTCSAGLNYSDHYYYAEGGQLLHEAQPTKSFISETPVTFRISGHDVGLLPLDVSIVIVQPQARRGCASASGARAEGKIIQVIYRRGHPAAMKITLVQSRGIISDPTVNFFKARMRINNVDSDIFVFPEMFCSGYTGKEEEMTLDMLDDRIVSKIAELSANRGCAVICGCPRKEDGKLYDCALLIDGRTVTEYRKMLPGSEGAFDETKVFTPGDRPMIIDHQGLLIGMSVGDDLLSPELFRFYAENGAHLLICISAFDEDQMDRFDRIAASRAAENRLPVILCNMVGSDCGVKLVGRSKYIGPDGRVIETCTESSDVREIMIDVEELKRAEACRAIVPKLTLGECIRVQSHSGQGENRETCAYTGAFLSRRPPAGGRGINRVD